MDTFILTWGEGPPLKNEVAPRVQPRSDMKVLSRLAFHPNNITLTVWVAYAARRRLRRKRAGSRWPAETAK